MHSPSWWYHVIKDTLMAGIDCERDLNALQAATGDSCAVLRRRIAASDMSAAVLLDMWRGGVRWYRGCTRVSAVIRQSPLDGVSYVMALRLAQIYEEQRLQKEARDA